MYIQQNTPNYNYDIHSTKRTFQVPPKMKMKTAVPISQLTLLFFLKQKRLSMKFV